MSNRKINSHRYYLQHREEILTKNYWRDWFNGRQTAKKWKDRNKEKVKAYHHNYNKAYYEKNKVSILAKRKSKNAPND